VVKRHRFAVVIRRTVRRVASPLRRDRQRLFPGTVMRGMRMPGDIQTSASARCLGMTAWRRA